MHPIGCKCCAALAHNKINDLFKEQKEKTIFKHVDKLAYLGSQKTAVKEFNFSVHN
ncbi:36215_t:CDS:2 [Gigaspora margarita]|uniref:36215_t:CDS:1 n=1 Tax=Gigaspora margarita TaxID=4874 RepID=A0ABN7UTS9_GIGMA|nr:36215_t:CDS:2 [Gigaspora margarita]